MSAWDAERAFERARVAYRFVADVYTKGTGYEPLDAHTAAAHEAERGGNMEGFEAALRDLMRTAKCEAKRERKAA